MIGIFDPDTNGKGLKMDAKDKANRHTTAGEGQKIRS